MAQRQLELSSERFRSELDAVDDRLIRATSLNDVRAAIAQTETQLASRQGLRNFDRLSPYINAAERYGKVVEVFCNSSPMVSYIWVSCLPLSARRGGRLVSTANLHRFQGPVKLIILVRNDLLSESGSCRSKRGFNRHRPSRNRQKHWIKYLMHMLKSAMLCHACLLFKSH